MKYLLYGLVLSVLFPYAVFALTPQQALERAFKDPLKDRALRVQMQMELAAKNVKTEKTEKTAWESSLASRTPAAFPKTNEGRFALRQVAPLPSESLMQIEWKLLPEDTYIRFTETTSSILQLAELFLPSLSQFTGQWIHVTSSATTDAQSLLTSPALLSGLSSATPDVADLLKKDTANKKVKSPPLFLPVRTEKNAWTANGKPVWRISAKLNPAVITQLHQKRLRTISGMKRASWETKSSFERFKRESVQTTNTQYRETLAYWKQPRFAMIIDPINSQLDRMEFFLATGWPSKKCPTLSSKAKACTVTFQNTLRITGAADFLPDHQQAIVPPSASTSWNDVLQQTDMAATTTNN